MHPKEDQLFVPYDISLKEMLSVLIVARIVYIQGMSIAYYFCFFIMYNFFTQCPLFVFFLSSVELIHYFSLAVASGKLDPDYVPNLKLTAPVFQIGPHNAWSDPTKIGTLDPFGHMITECFAKYLEKGFDIRPTIAVTKAHIDLPECREALAKGRLVPDGKVLLPSGQAICSKAAIEPVWFLPEVARRFGCTESHLRQSLFRMTNGMYPELITRPDIKIFLPPMCVSF